ncbi:MAG: potassium channel protein [Candidatus Chloroheliales bacterium]|nr:MAG: potassium channel protein [Chloroflexota bacterium]
MRDEPSKAEKKDQRASLRRALLGAEGSVKRIRELAGRLRFTVLVLLTFLALGTAAFMLVEGWSLGDALYMTITTVTTVGYQEVHPLDGWGRVVASLVVIGGLGILLYVLGAVTELAVETQASGLVRRRRMQNQINQMRDHYIICGYGRMGQMVAQQLLQEHHQVVVVDNNPDSAEVARGRELPVLNGDATSDEVLREAGIKRARALIASSDSDAGNIFITLSARALNPDLLIVGRVGNTENSSKIRMAGADHVVSPYELGGLRMATLATRPAVANYLDILMHDETTDFGIEEVLVGRVTQLGALLQAVRGEAPTVLAIHCDERKLIPNPGLDAPIAAGDRLIVVGTRAQLRALEVAVEGLEVSI